MTTFKILSTGEICVKLSNQATKKLLRMIEDNQTSDEGLSDFVSSYLVEAMSPISTSRKIQNSQLNAVLSSMDSSALKSMSGVN